jgi:hypothetical protein
MIGQIKGRWSGRWEERRRRKWKRERTWGGGRKRKAEQKHIAWRNPKF